MKSTQLTRRSIIRGAGAVLALPWLECMGGEKGTTPDQEPRRLFVLYAPGATSPGYWYCQGEGKDYQMSLTLKAIERHRENLTVVRGLQHIQGQIAGHPHAVNYLTGHNIMQGAGFPNTVSMDQVFARYHSNTYCRSLQISEEGGIFDGTLSRNELGADVPALAAPEDIWKALMPPNDPDDLKALNGRLINRKTLVDALHTDITALGKSLCYTDRQRLQQYADSMHEIEQYIQDKRAAIDRGAPLVDQGTFDLAEQAAGRTRKGSLKRRIKQVMDLVALGFQADLTRVATYICSGSDNGFWGPVYEETNEWIANIKPTPTLKNLTHGVWHWSNAVKNVLDLAAPGAQFLAQRDRMMVEGIGYLMDKLAAMPAKGGGTVLDYTQIVYGGSQMLTHSGVDGPLFVAGGKALGWKHGQHKVYYRKTGVHEAIDKAKIPLSNMWLTILQQAGCPVQTFKESTGTLSELLK